MADAQQSRRPQDSPFFQQRLKAWQPILTPKWVVISFIIVGVIFVPIGIGLKLASDSVVEVVVQYDGSSVTSNSISGNCQLPTGTYTPTSCNITITAPATMKSPIYVYYELDNFYQNHRRYVKSIAPGQMTGSFSASTTDCDPLVNAPNGKILFPCGLIAGSMFNDTFQVLTPSVNMSEKDISWPSDRADKYKNPSPADIASHIGQYQFLNQTYPGVIHGEDVENEHFQVWMRTAALPHFRKLYGRIYQTLNKGDTVTFAVNSNFHVRSFSGSKSLVLSTTSWLGGKNPFLGIAYIVVGSVCLFLAVVFAIRQKVSGRALGDPKGLVWTTPKH